MITIVKLNDAEFRNSNRRSSLCFVAFGVVIILTTWTFILVRFIYNRNENAEIEVPVTWLNTTAYTKAAPFQTKCNVSSCDDDMFLSNTTSQVYHVPNLNQLPLNSWLLNTVNSGKLKTTIAGTNSLFIVKYGGFCNEAQSQLFFLGSVAFTFPNPSWIAKIPSGNTDILGNFKKGIFKIDITINDLVNMNQIATTCLELCKMTNDCKYVSYGWETPSEISIPPWFCKFYSKLACTELNWWKTTAPDTSINIGSLSPSTFGGCRVTDTIPVDTPLVTSGSQEIFPDTPFTQSLPYLNEASYINPNGVVASIKCDATNGELKIGSPTFGAVWI